jgi:4-hydroxy-tetrahydrodipicolinate reductase
MKIILSGFGKMGREVEAVALQRGHTIAVRIDPVDAGADAKTLSKEIAATGNVVIEFALPLGIEERVTGYCAHKLPAVIATTGWNDKIGAIKTIVEKSGTGLVYGANFSIGANLFFKIVRAAVKLANQFPEYDLLAYELHHKRKKDSPSGTALTTAGIILDESSVKEKLVTERLDRAIAPDELHFASIRGGSIPGIHTVLFDSEADTIEITHNARNRSGLALGAVLAAEWISGKKGIYEFSDFMREKLTTDKHG